MSVAGDYIGRVRLGVTIGAAGSQSFTWPDGRPDGTYTADAGPDGVIVLAVTEVGDDSLTVSWAADQARRMIGHPWRVLRDGTWLFGDLYVIEAEPSDDDPADFTVLDGVVEVTVAMVAPGTGGVTDHGDLTGRDAADQHPASAITVGADTLEEYLAARGDGSSDYVQVPTGTMPLVEGFYPPATQSGTNYLASIDAALTGLSGIVTSTGEDLVALTATVDTISNDLDTIGNDLGTAEAAVAALEAAEYDAQAVELVRGEAAARTSTAPTFALCAPLIDGDHHDYAWQHDPPGDYTTGAWARFDDLVVLPMADVAPSPTTARTYSEIATQTHDEATTTPPADPGVWDNEEDAAERRWSTTNNSWLVSLFYEWTEIGGTSEAHSLSTAGTFDLVPSVAYTIVRWLEFNVGGNWRLRWFRRVWHETPTHSFDGADWVLIHTITGTGTTSIDTGVADQWGYGYGQGSLLCRKITKRDAGPTGTLLAEVDAADAAAGGDLAFTDGAGNTVTPGAEAATFTPGSGSGVALGETSTTAYRGDRGKTAYDHSQVVTGNPHGTTAADVGAVADDDARLSDTRTPTDASVTAAKLDATLAARIPTFVWASADSAARTTAGAKADDSDLKFAGAANTRYRVDMHLQFSGDATADVTVGITGPTGATCSLFMDYFGGAVAAASAVNQAGAHISAVGAGGAIGGGVIASPGLAYRITGWVQLSSTAGDVSLYWGPTSNGAGTGVIRHANSHLIHTP